MEDIAPALQTICDGRIAYLRLSPEVPDFTNRQECKLEVFGRKTTVSIPFDRNNLKSVYYLLRHSVFSSGMDCLFAYNLKPLYTYLKWLRVRAERPSCRTVDLQVFSNFTGYGLQQAPENLAAAVNTFQSLQLNPSFLKLYSGLHEPLMYEVLPALEATGIADINDKKVKHCYYEVEGQQNGRLRSAGRYANSFLPHTMTEEVKRSMRARNGQHFVTADIKYCEIVVLQWLTKDRRLQAVIEGEEDVYRSIYRLVTDDVCDNDNKRRKCKLMALPIIYGCGAKSLSAILELSQSVCQELLKRFNNLFPDSMGWLKEQEGLAEKGLVTDYFGRCRSFLGEAYKVRNFLVQSVAATVCLEKLVALYRALPKEASLCYSVHDEYGLACPPDAAPETAQLVQKVLAAESAWCPGLRLTSHVRYGPDLGHLQGVT